MATLRRSDPSHAATGTIVAPEEGVAIALLNEVMVAAGDFAGTDAESLLVPVYGQGSPDPTMIESFFYVDMAGPTLYFRSSPPGTPIQYTAVN